MKSPFKATAILGGSSIASILVGLVSAKVMATILQPTGYGLYGLLQSFVGLCVLVAGLGVATGIVRLGAGAVVQNDQLTIASLRKASWILLGGLGGTGILVIGLFRHTLSRMALGTPHYADAILLMAVALFFTLTTNIQNGILNAYHRVAALAKIRITSTVAVAAVAITTILIWRLHGIVPAILAGTVVSCAVSRYFLRKELGPTQVHPTRSDTLKAAWSLLRFGGPYTLSMMVGTGVQLALPIVVLHLLSTESVGYYRASVAISVGYLGFLVTAMGQDYYPRVAAMADKPKELVKLVNEEHRLVMVLAVPLILGTLALVPYLVPLVYSPKFLPAVEILEWQLIGDLFKFSSWTMSFVILARCKSSTYFLTEAIGGGANLLMVWLAVRWFGLAGLGIAFLASYIIYYCTVWLILRHEIPLAWTASNKKMMLAAVAAALLVRVLPFTEFASFRTPVALVLAFAAGIPSLVVIWRELIAPEHAAPGAA